MVTGRREFLARDPLSSSIILCFTPALALQHWGGVMYFLAWPFLATTFTGVKAKL